MTLNEKQSIEINAEIHRLFHIGAKDENLKSLKEIIYLAMEISQTLTDAKKVALEWERYGDWMRTKMFFHAESICELINGTSLEWARLTAPKKVIDPLSINVLFRAFLETFLMHNFIYLVPKSDEEKKFRFNVWMYSGLMNRQKFSAESKYAKEAKLHDQGEIEKIKKEIIGDKHFMELTDKQKKKLLDEGETKLFRGWKKVIKECGLSSELIMDTTYSFVSMYAHTESVSILQIKDGLLTNPKLIMGAVRQRCFEMKIILSIFIIEMIKYFKIIEIRFNGLSSIDQTKIIEYSKLGFGK